MLAHARTIREHDEAQTVSGCLPSEEGQAVIPKQDRDEEDEGKSF